MTQADRLVEHFLAGGSLTVGEALTAFGIYALSQRCGEIRRRRGLPIISQEETTPGGARVKRYSLDLSQVPVEYLSATEYRIYMDRMRAAA